MRDIRLCILLLATLASAKGNAKGNAVCDLNKSRNCIVDFWKLVDEADDTAKYCSRIQPTQDCVMQFTAGCNEEQKKQRERFQKTIVDGVGDECEDLIEPYHICGQSITVVEGGPVYPLQFKMAKSPGEICKGQQNCQVFVDLILQNKDRSKSGCIFDSKQVVCKEENGQPCSRHITDATWRQPVSFHLVAALDNQVDGVAEVEVNIVVRKVINGVPQKRRTVCSVQVYVIDKDKTPGGVCKSTNDPHMTSFDGRYYHNYMQGLFLMYRHKELPYEVQAIFQPCGPASCNCGVAVRSGDFVFVVESCARRASVCDNNRRHICNTNNLRRMYTFGDAGDPGMKIFTKGPSIEVLLPHGTRVSIQHDARHKFSNFVIYGSVLDWGTDKTEGLCGNFDGNKNNDLTTSTGEIYQPRGRQANFPDHFSASWRLGHDQSIFSGISGIKYRTPRYCASRFQGDADCGTLGLVEYCHLPLGTELPLPRMTVAPNIPLQQNGRNRRAADTELTDMDLMDFIELGDGNNTSPRSAPVMSEVQARSYCQNHLTAKEEWSEWCMKMPNMTNDQWIQPCVDDLMMTGDHSWADTALEGFKQDCMTHLTRDTEYLKSEEGQGMKDDIMSRTCDNMCSNNGVCSNGNCNCTAPFTGHDCSFSPETTIPEFLSLANDGLCDVTRGNCSNVVLYGTKFVDSPSLTCHFVGFEITKDGTRDVGTKFKTEATFMIDSQIICPTPTPPPNLFEPVAWTVDVSNDGIKPSQSPVLLVSHDPHCTLCRINVGNVGNNTATCQKMGCVIDNKCYGDGHRNPSDNCLQCNPSHSTSEWSDVMFCNLNLPALIICPLVALLICGIIGYCVYRHTKKDKSEKQMNDEETRFNVADSKPVRLTQR